VHEGEPDVRCELAGAFAELKLPAFGPYVPGATAANATEADKAKSNIDNAVMIASRFIRVDPPESFAHPKGERIQLTQMGALFKKCLGVQRRR